MQVGGKNRRRIFAGGQIQGRDCEWRNQFEPPVARTDGANLDSWRGGRLAYAQPPARCILNHFHPLELFLTQGHHPYRVTKSRCSYGVTLSWSIYMRQAELVTAGVPPV